MAIFPFGLVIGFTITALPFLLTNLGIPLYKVATISATVMSPTFWGFLLQPVMDTGLTRRSYCWLTATSAAICLAASPHTPMAFADRWSCQPDLRSDFAVVAGKASPEKADGAN
ncbi:MAG: hypothetical protein ACYC46_15175 [Acidobacteriaceae bacterium]